MDQYIAQKIGRQTRFASLEFGCEERIQGGNCDNGYRCAYSPWRTESTPNPPEVRLRGSRVPVRERRGRAPSRSSRETRTIPEERFGSVLRDAERLQGQLGSTDRRKLDEYLYAVREIETRIQKTEHGNAQIIPNLDKPAPSIPENDSDHTRMMFDLMTVASQTDPTRVVTFLTAIEQSNRAYREIGIADSHHGLTHHGGNKEKIEKCININRCQLEQFAYFMGKLKATQDGDGTLLDRVMVTYGSGLSQDHEHDKLIDGHHGSRQRSLYLRQALEVYERNPLANLHVAIMNRMGRARRAIRRQQRKTRVSLQPLTVSRDGRLP